MADEFTQRLRVLLKEHDEALAAVNSIMSMETFLFLDLEKRSSLRDDLTLQKIHKTRLLRVDLGARTRTDPFQRWLHKYLRAFRHWKLSGKLQVDTEGFASIPKTDRTWLYQNTISIAEFIGQVTTAAVTAVFPIAPLAILSYQSSKTVQRAANSVCIPIVSLLVSLFVRVLSFEMMARAAVYMAVQSMFASNVPNVPPSA